MIEEVHITGFQSHKDTLIKLNSGVNVIVGSSDCGKTAIIRALHWLFYNKPSGDSFRSNWGGETKVSIKINGIIVSRIKEDKGDSYVIKKPGKKAKILKAFGANVPEIISKFLNIDEVNLQQQLDAPFLLSETPGKVSAYFNKMANLDKIDTSIQYINKEIRQTTSTLKFKEKDLQVKEQSLEEYLDLPIIEIRVERLEKLDTKISKWDKKILIVEKIAAKILSIDKSLTSHKQTLLMEEDVNSLLDLIYEKQELSSKIDSLDVLITRLRKIKGKEDSLNILIMSEKDIDKLIKLSKRKKDIEQLHTNLENLIKKCVSVNTKINPMEEKIKELENKFHKYMPEICPLCGTNLKMKKINQNQYPESHTATM